MLARCGPARGAMRRIARAQQRRSTTTAGERLRNNPGTYWTIPVVAAAVGFGTNYVGVQALFYPIDYIGLELWRLKDSPWGLFGWQGVVPTKCEQMSARLVDVITAKLLSLPEAFGRIDACALGSLLSDHVADAIARDAGLAWAFLLRPALPWALARCVRAMQRDIDDILDLEHVVSTAFLASVLRLGRFSRDSGWKNRHRSTR